MKLLIKFRAKRKNSNEWVYGFYAFKQIIDKHFILREETVPYSRETIFEEIEVDHTTLGQLRYTNQHGEYFDGDVYYHAGYGMEKVSDICELQFALAHGNGDDICDIKGNVFDNPDIMDDPKYPGCD